MQLEWSSTIVMVLRYNLSSQLTLGRAFEQL